MPDKLQKFCVISLTQGGKHADNTVDLQEFMIMPTGACCLEKGIRMCAEVYQHLKLLLREKGLSTAVGDEGGFAPDLSDSEKRICTMLLIDYTTKEISDVLNISEKSINNIRSKIRKKMDVPENFSISQFLKNI